MGSTAFSQTDSTTYPKTVLIGGQSVTQFYTWQAKDIAKQLVTGDMYEVLHRTTEIQLFTCELVLTNKDTIIAEKEEKIDFMMDIDSYRDSVETEHLGIIDSQDIIINKLNKKIRSSKIRNWVIGIAATVGIEELFRNIYKNK
jgi:hypothetical protein